MLRRLKILVLLLIIGIISLSQAGCPSPAGPPATPIELPTVLKFVSYQGLQVDLNAISAQMQGGAQTLGSKAIEFSYPNPTQLPQKQLGDDVSLLITFGPDFFNTFDNFFVQTINGIQQIEVPIDKTRTCFKGSISLSSGYLSGRHDVILDFAPFDFDNDGAIENCTGNTGELPICVRFWLGGGRFIAGVFESLPIYAGKCEDNYCPAEEYCTCSQYVINELGKFNKSISNCDANYCANHPRTTCTCDTNILDTPILIGEGRFKVLAKGLESAGIGMGFDLLTKYKYEQLFAEEKEKKDVDYFFQIRPADITSGHIDGFNIEGFDGHSELSQIGPKESAFTTLNINTQLQGEFQTDVGSLKDIDLNYIGQFIEGVNFWGGNIKADFLGPNTLIGGTTGDLVPIEIYL